MRPWQVLGAASRNPCWAVEQEVKAEKESERDQDLGFVEREGIIMVVGLMVVHCQAVTSDGRSLLGGRGEKSESQERKGVVGCERAQRKDKG